MKKERKFYMHNYLSPHDFDGDLDRVIKYLTDIREENKGKKLSLDWSHSPERWGGGGRIKLATIEKVQLYKK